MAMPFLFYQRIPGSDLLSINFVSRHRERNETY